MATTEAKIYTIQEYLCLEVEAKIRSEFRNGEIVPMTGGTPEHNELIRALTVLFSLELRGQPYRLFLADQRLWIAECNLYTYPDFMVIQQPVELQVGRKDTVVNPILIAEVLSNSTKSYDRDEKFAAYRTLETFQEYLLIDQHRVRVEQYVKQSANRWLLTEYTERDARVVISTVPVELSLAELYENLEF